MIGIIIAGGFGTRLRPLTLARPKHLLPVANRPFLEYQVALLRRHGITRIVFAAGYLADQIQAHFGDGVRFGVEMTYAVEREPLGTGGAIRHAAESAPAETAVVLNGDILTDFDIASLVAFHRDRQASATIALRSVRRPHGFGVLDTAADGRVHAWREPSDAEKKRAAAAAPSDEAGSDLINAGIYVLEPEVLHGIPAGRFVSIERETYPALLASGAPVYGTAPQGYWLDMGSPQSYLAAVGAVLTGAVRTEVPFHQVGEGAVLAPDARLDATTAVGRECQVGPGAGLLGCIILDGVTVGARAELRGLIAEEGTHIGDEVTSRGGTVLATGSVVARGSHI